MAYRGRPVLDALLLRLRYVIATLSSALWAFGWKNVAADWASVVETLSSPEEVILWQPDPKPCLAGAESSAI